MSTATGDAHEGAEAPTLLDTLARVPAVAALVVAGLSEADRKALRLAHSQLRDAVGEATITLEADFWVVDARPPTASRWPRLEELFIEYPSSAALEALGSETWSNLHTLFLDNEEETLIGDFTPGRLDAPSARALAAALRRMPALRALELHNFLLSRAAAAVLFRRSSAEDVPRLRSVTAWARLAPRTMRALAASGWRLEELDLRGNTCLGAAGLTALIAAPTFAIRRLGLAECDLDAAALLALAVSPWPLEELDLSYNDFSAAAAGRALAALSRHRCLRRLDVGDCHLTTAGVDALIEACRPVRIFLKASTWAPPNHGRRDAAASPDFRALEELVL